MKKTRQREAIARVEVGLLILIISATQSLLGLASGMLVGFSLGLVGGGGSILAVPLMVYVVGVPDPHVAIGTSAIAVAANAAVNLSNHARGGTVVWSCALPFAAAGMIGALGGSILGKMLDGQKLLALFALLMLVIAVLMLKTRSRIGLPDVQMSWPTCPRSLGLGLVTGTMSGFFGIGGGFLIVPALMLATGMPIMNAVQFLAGGGDRLRHDHGRQLCLVRPDLVGAGGIVRRGRHCRRTGRNALGAAPVGAARRAQHRVRHRHYCGGALYAGA